MKEIICTENRFHANGHSIRCDMVYDREIIFLEFTEDQTVIVMVV